MKDWFNKLPEVLQPYAKEWLSFPKFLKEHEGYDSEEEAWEYYHIELNEMLDYDIRNDGMYDD